MALKKPKEITVEDHYCKEILTAFPTSETFKFEARMGEPDRLSLLPGARAVFVELKRPGLKPKTKQERCLNRKRKLGFEAHYADTKDKVDALILYLLATAETR